MNTAFPVQLMNIDRAAMDEIRRRKLQGMPDAEEFVDRTLSCFEMEWADNSRYPYSNNSDVSVNFVATFAGVLYYRGDIMNNIQSRKPMSQWPVQVILSLFISGTDPHRSFSKHFEQTRIRLLHYVCERVSKQYCPLQASYILACMEYRQMPSFYDPEAPTQHMVHFAKLFQLEPAKYLVQDHNQNAKMREQLPRYLQIALNSKGWNKEDTSLESMIAFLYPHGVEDIDKDVKSQQNKRKKKRRGGRDQKKMGDEDQAMTAQTEEATSSTDDIVVDRSRLQAVILQKPLLQALFAPMPGLTWTNKDSLQLEPVKNEEWSSLAEELARVNFDAEVAASTEKEFEVEDVVNALSVNHMEHTRGSVELTDSDQIYFDDWVEQVDLQSILFGGDEDAEMEDAEGESMEM
ncbi:hypothetical protein E8E13_007750 [Curvularia kusanoi]|uniref:Uncharacterized protein n=1 Tax=Curvularia kusanoi TaxID=90978 RepID=A0A9P4TAZ6_CURKU|nr:hypothetical protein E8E13_007750 [Curvularia kusanoi]